MFSILPRLDACIISLGFSDDGDEASVAIPPIRQDARKLIATRGKGSEWAVQEATDTAVDEIERLVKAKGDEMAI